MDSQAAATLTHVRENKKKTNDEQRVEQALRERPPLEKILNLADMAVCSLFFLLNES